MPQLHSDRLMKQTEPTVTTLGNLVTPCNGELSVILYTQLIWRVLRALTLTLEFGNVPWEIFLEDFGNISFRCIQALDGHCLYIFVRPIKDQHEELNFLNRIDMSGNLHGNDCRNKNHLQK